jgi:transposase
LLTSCGAKRTAGSFLQKKYASLSGYDAGNKLNKITKRGVKTMSLAPFFQFEGYKVAELEGHPAIGEFNVELVRKDTKPALCHVCGTSLGVSRGRHRVVVKDTPVFSCPIEIRFWREKGHCTKCKKARSEKVDFLSTETPHLTAYYAWWLGRLSEITSVKQAAHFVHEAPQTLWRIDFARLKNMMTKYNIPNATRIGVDEVYARKKKHPGESRDDLFFTVIIDLVSRRVIWVSDSRKREALEEFFEKIGPERCKKIEVVAVDQHEEYAKAIRSYCSRAKIVWDRFHIVRNFLDAVNETRKAIIAKLPNAKKKLITSKVRKFLFLTKGVRRKPEDQATLEEALKDNEELAKLELIKERMISFFDAENETEGRKVFAQVGRWIREADFKPLFNWWKFMRGGWLTLRNYFKDRITSALSEGMNNVVKSIKRRSFGFRNMEYFKLKIMQVCGMLNSRHYPDQDGIFVRGISLTRD